MQPIRITLTAPSTTGGYANFFPDNTRDPFQIGVGITTTSTTITMSMQYTYDYTGSSAFISSNATWFESSGVSSATANTVGIQDFPVSALRVSIGSGSTSGATTVTFLQAG